MLQETEQVSRNLEPVSLTVSVAKDGTISSRFKCFCPIPSWRTSKGPGRQHAMEEVAVQGGECAAMKDEEADGSAKEDESYDDTQY